MAKAKHFPCFDETKVGIMFGITKEWDPARGCFC